MASVTVRVRGETHDALRTFSARTHRKMGDLLDEAVELYRRRLFLAEANAAFAGLRADPRAWAEETEEREAWAAALSDGDAR
jgi:hypothetical protein